MCTNEGGRELTESVLTTGQIVGGVIFTQLPDLYGRKKIYVIFFNKYTCQ